MNDLPTILNRRAFLGTAGNSFGAVALTSMLARGDSIPHPAYRLEAGRRRREVPVLLADLAASQSRP